MILKKTLITGIVLSLGLVGGCGEPPTGADPDLGIDGKADVWGEPSETTRSSCLVSSASPCLAEDPVLVESTLTEWTEQMTAVARSVDELPPLGLTECRWVHEVQGALLCGSYRQSTMNALLARATMFIEGMVIGHSGEVVSTDDPLNEEAASSIGGHDLRSEDLMGFYAAADQACSLDARMCLTPHEQAMRELLTGVLQNYGSFVVVTFSLTCILRPHAVVGHEILHAQYFLNDTFRATVDAYWAGLEPEEQVPIIEVLGLYYDPQDDYLMRNEFQAYILQTNPETGVLASFVPLHREPLTAALRHAGTPPVQCEVPASSW